MGCKIPNSNSSCTSSGTSAGTFSLLGFEAGFFFVVWIGSKSSVSSSTVFVFCARSRRLYNSFRLSRFLFPFIFSCFFNPTSDRPPQRRVQPWNPKGLPRTDEAFPSAEVSAPPAAVPDPARITSPDPPSSSPGSPTTPSAEPSRAFPAGTAPGPSAPDPVCRSETAKLREEPREESPDLLRESRETSYLINLISLAYSQNLCQPTTSNASRFPNPSTFSLKLSKCYETNATSLSEFLLQMI